MKKIDTIDLMIHTDIRPSLFIHRGDNNCKNYIAKTYLRRLRFKRLVDAMIFRSMSHAK